MLDDARELAAQTGLLALNIAIESSRSGEAGRQWAAFAARLLNYSKSMPPAQTSKQAFDGRSDAAQLAARMDTYVMALQQELSNISSLSDDLDNLVLASVESLLALDSADNVYACDLQRAQQLIRLAADSAKTKSKMDASIAEEKLKMISKLDALRQAVDKSNLDGQTDANVEYRDIVDRNDNEMV